MSEYIINTSFFKVGLEENDYGMYEAGVEDGKKVPVNAIIFQL